MACFVERWNKPDLSLEAMQLLAGIVESVKAVHWVELVKSVKAGIRCFGETRKSVESLDC